MNPTLNLNRATRAELIDAAIWLQRDAEYLYRRAREYAACPSWQSVAGAVQRNAAYSAQKARECMDKVATL